MDPAIAELFDLKNKVAVVTGGAVGIGARIAELLASAGACIAIADTDIHEANRTTSRIQASRAIARAFTCDVGRTDAVRRMLDAVTETFGHVDVVVNNAGIFPAAAALEVTEAVWDRVLEVNLRGAFFLAQAAAQQMIRQGDGGSIINIASTDGMHPTGRLVHYDASKAGLIMMTRSLAFELGPRRIRVNAIAPGVVQTPGVDTAMRARGEGTTLAHVTSQLVSRIPLGRMGTPDDVARAVLFLASRAADYVTGSTLVVDGGLLLS